MTNLDLDAMEQCAREAHSVVVVPRDTMMLSTGAVLALIGRVRAAEAALASAPGEPTEAQVIAGARALIPLIDPAWPYYEYDELSSGLAHLHAAVRAVLRAAAATDRENRRPCRLPDTAPPCIGCAHGCEVTNREKGSRNDA